VRQAELGTQLRAVEVRRLAALRSADTPTLEALHAADYQLITPGGAALSRDAYLGQIAEGVLVYRQFEPEGEIAIRPLGAAAAAVRYEALIDAAFPGGHDRDRFWHTDLYEFRNGRWQAVWSQATRIIAR
jgi:hypothetical protein